MNRSELAPFIGYCGAAVIPLADKMHGPGVNFVPPAVFVDNSDNFKISVDASQASV